MKSGSQLLFFTNAVEGLTPLIPTHYGNRWERREEWREQGQQRNCLNGVKGEGKPANPLHSITKSSVVLPYLVRDDGQHHQAALARHLFHNQYSESYCEAYAVGCD